MPREKFKTLTEKMFYILLCLCEERCGIEILDSVRDLTDDRVKIGSGTLYDLLEQFTKEGMICETKIEGRRRSYRITEKGLRMLDAEYQRLSLQAADYARISKGGTPWKLENTKIVKTAMTANVRSNVALPMPSCTTSKGLKKS